MKVLAVILLCTLAAVQGRSAVVSSTESKELAELGEHPYIVHLRIAVSTSGQLNTCAGSIINERWVLTAQSCANELTFVWIRLGCVNVPKPSFVVEANANAATVHPTADVALINAGRDVRSIPNVSPVVGFGGSIPSTARIFSFGYNDAGGPGEQLVSFNARLETTEEDEIIAYSDVGASTHYDQGMPLMVNGVQIGILGGAGTQNAGIFSAVEGYRGWIRSVTGMELPPSAVHPDSVDA